MHEAICKLCKKLTYTPAEELRKKKACSSCRNHSLRGRSRWPADVAAYRFWLHAANQTNRKVGLSFEQWWAVASLPCAYCGAPPKENRRGVFHNGLDRIDNAGDYVPENVCSCCIACNKMKHIASLDAFLQQVARIYRQRQLDSMALGAAENNGAQWCPRTRPLRVDK